ncbi:site-specific integrase [Sutcliffiella cohnii]|uniref:tyrosine-type recombinase/integrase n=1 Tax=Sutcliffiella cohnii TaxID=33932 RepID=UPI002E2115E7|nr:site-specific integrase [Sutcliffiella cohnii]
MKSTNIQNKHLDIEESITGSTLVVDGLHAMREYKNWSENTYEAYLKDVQHYSEFCYSIQKEPILSTARLHIVDKWIKEQKEADVSVSTIQRRVACLSSIYKCYKELGTVSSNPFKIAEVPVGLKGHHSRVLEMEELSEVYHALEQMEQDGYDVGVTVRVMLMTGLRNSALTELKVKDVSLEQKVITYNAGIVNSKHKLQIFPIPPKLFYLLEEYIKRNHLQPDDTLLNGLKGGPLRAKQLNRITDKICEFLNWSGELHVTPHGLRASIATILDERGVSRDTIKFLLGHSDEEDTLASHYIRRNRRKIEKLRHELSMIEQEIEEGGQKIKNGNEQTEHPNKALEEKEGNADLEETSKSSTSGMISEEKFLKIMAVNETVALKLLEKNLVSFE